ncbi:MAG TPA: peptidoglycan-associated lipoprotein Pal [Candidatus Binatia bacterium]|nr:peptidoglycan-associated lipoprotein Pal [Candidatus Binatia bacterium]
MKRTASRWTKALVALAVVLTVSACGKKKAAPPPPPPPPPAPAPTASLTANPNTIQAGQSTTLIWKTDFATDVSIDQFGKVDPSGSRTVTPTESTTYRLVAKNDTGTQEATARVTVTAAPPPPPAPSQTEAQLFAQNVQDVFYEYDSYDISQQYQQVLQKDASFLQQHPNVRFTIEGHCDERGSTEYNLALGDNRANAAKQALISLGISADRIRTISYGKEKPFCTESNESCWQQNRRAHFVYQQQ